MLKSVKAEMFNCCSVVNIHQATDWRTIFPAGSFPVRRGIMSNILDLLSFSLISQEHQLGNMAKMLTNINLFDCLSVQACCPVRLCSDVAVFPDLSNYCGEYNRNVSNWNMKYG